MTSRDLELAFNFINTYLPGSFTISVLVFLLFMRIKHHRGIKRVASVLEDWNGQEARPGKDRVPGVMERLYEIDGQLKNNGGSSVKDAVDRIETRVLEINNRLSENDKRVDEIQSELKRINKDLY
jgi:hypothetical protein